MVSIRRAAQLDAPDLCEFARRVFNETFAPHNTPEDMDAYLSSAFSTEKQLEEIEDPLNQVLLAERDETLVGFALLRASEQPECVSDPSAIELVRFYVDPALHGRGVAQTLMKAVVAEATSRTGTIWLGVWEHNRRAIAFYAKCGFVDVGSHPFLLGQDLQTDRIMARSLAIRPEPDEDRRA